MRFCGTLFDQHAHDFRNNVASPTDNHRVADLYVLAPDLVFVVQRRIGHRHAADEYGFEPSYRRDSARASHLHVDPNHLGRHLFGRKLVSDRPAWLARYKPELLLQRERVHLIDHAIDLERQIGPTSGNPLVELGQLRRALRNAAIVIDRNTECAEGVEQLTMGFRQGKAAGFSDAICKEAQRTLTRHRRIELAYRAGRRVTRVDESLTSGCLLSCVQFREVASRHVNFPAHLEHGGKRTTA